MADVNMLIAELHASIHQPKRELGLTFFHLVYEVEHALDHDQGYAEKANGTLTLIWQDKSVSSIRFTDPALLTTDGLPLDTWRQLRYFQPELHRSLLQTEQTSDIPSVPLVDPAIKTIVDCGPRPLLAADFSWRLSYTTRTVVDSLWLYREEQRTAAILQASNPAVPVSWTSSRLPTSTEIKYLSAEHAWYLEQLPAATEGDVLVPAQSAVLLAPDALRSILRPCWHARLLPADFCLSSIHRQASAEKMFRDWLRRERTAVFIPELTVIPAAGANEPHLVAARAYVFGQGRLRRYGTAMLSLSGHELVCSLAPITIRKIGWNGNGVLCTLWQSNLT
ncbi:hypothetical protein ACTID9_19075 [Brevibacillus fluminis]|uniref:hypothetical protein n=1 Tax=Brevibacillus fluminis TaxID=511487 RepID=UPI003F8B758C